MRCGSRNGVRTFVLHDTLQRCGLGERLIISDGLQLIVHFFALFEFAVDLLIEFRVVWQAFQIVVHVIDVRIVDVGRSGRLGDALGSDQPTLFGKINDFMAIFIVIVIIVVRRIRLAVNSDVHRLALQDRW